jgi:hypothetical protein
LARKRATKIAVVNEVLLDMRVNGWDQERYETILAATGLDNVEEEFVAPLEDALDDEEGVREDTDPDGFLWAVGARLGVDIVEDGKAWEFPTDREPLELDGDGVESVRFEGEYPGHPHLPLGVSQYEMMKLDLWDGYVESRAREYQRLQETDWKLADAWLDNGTIWERNAILDKRQELFGDYVPHVADIDPGAIGCEGYEIADDVNVNDLHKIIIAHQLGRVSLDEVKRTAVRSGWVRRSSTIATAHRH